MSDEGGDRPFGQDAHDELLKRRLDAYKDAYREILNRIWAGNAGGAVTTITALGFLAKDTHHFNAFALIALVCFASGLILLGLGAIMSLMSEKRMIHNLEDAQSPLDLKVGTFPRPSEATGFVSRKPKTWPAFLAAIAFVVGVLAGLIGVLVHASFS